LAGGTIEAGQTAATFNLVTTLNDRVLEEQETGFIRIEASAGGKPVYLGRNGVYSLGQDVELMLEDRVLGDLKSPSNGAREISGNVAFGKEILLEATTTALISKNMADATSKTLIESANKAAQKMLVSINLGVIGLELTTDMNSISQSLPESTKQHEKAKALAKFEVNFLVAATEYAYSIGSAAFFAGFVEGLVLSGVIAPILVPAVLATGAFVAWKVIEPVIRQQLEKEAVENYKLLAPELTPMSKIPGIDGPNTYAGTSANEEYKVDTANDALIESSNGGYDLVISSASFTLPKNVEALVLEGAAADGIGNSGNNSLTGNGLSNTLFGKGVLITT
jgi:hypothetical protein